MDKLELWCQVVEEKGLRLAMFATRLLSVVCLLRLVAKFIPN